MGANTRIEWTDATWNPARGCTRVSPGCGGPGSHGGCYAEIIAARFSKPGQWGHGFAEMKGGDHRWTGKVELIESQLGLPLSWKAPRRIFVNSTSDLFHEQLSYAAIDRVFAVMAMCPQHTFQVLTKRPKRMRDYISAVVETFHASPDCMEARFANVCADVTNSPCAAGAFEDVDWPLPNVWLGVSVEDQPRADERIPHLLATPAAVRFLSCEPLLGRISLRRISTHGGWYDALAGWRDVRDSPAPEGVIDWVICGGESGPGARPMHPYWARSLRDDCANAGVPFFFKQWGEWVPFMPHAGGDLGAEVRAGHVRIVHPTGQTDVQIFQETGGRNTIAGSRYMARVGKQKAGNFLDGRSHLDLPATFQTAG